MSSAAVPAGSAPAAPSEPQLSIWQRLDDSVNPIVVKELRQAVQSRFVVAVLVIFLFVQLAFIGIYLLSSGIEGRLDNFDYREGRSVFNGLQIILLSTCMLFLPLYTGLRLAAERNEANTDLFFITTISPRAIIFGKIVSAMLIAVLIFSACIPFMALTFYLRGIDWTSILAVLVVDFLAILAGVQLMVFVAVIPSALIFRIILGVFGLIGLLYLFIGTILMTTFLLERGLFETLFGTDRLIAGIVSTLSLGLGTSGLLFVWSIALLSPPSSNRMLPVRIYLAFLWLISMVAVTAVCIHYRTFDGLIAWACFMLALSILNVLVAINERRSWSLRIARTIPVRFLPRLLAFLFYGGVASGMIFSFLFASVSVLVVLASDELFASMFGGRFRSLMSDPDKDVVLAMGVLFLYVFAYGLTAILVQQGLRGSVRSSFTWLIFLLLFAFGSVMPYLISFLIYMDRWRFESHYVFLLTNPFAAFYAFVEHGRYGLQTPRAAFGLTAALWSSVAFLILNRWFIRQWSAFKRYVPPPMIEMANPASPSAPATDLPLPPP